MNTVRAILVLAAATSVGCFGEPPCDTPACNADVGTDADPSSGWSEERAFFLPPETFVEAQLEMAAGDRLTAEFDCDSLEVSWNVHSHENDQTNFHVIGRDSSGSFQFVAPTADTYFPMWINDEGAALHIDVRMRFEGSTQLVRWR